MRDPQVHYDGKKILFSYRKSSNTPFHLYEINTDGTNLKQLTNSKYDDIEPTYVADGSIVFISARSKRFVPCWSVPTATLFRCDGNGKNVRSISGNLDADLTPWPLPDGRILFMRWEYVDRSQMVFHHLWTMNPDGTNQMVYYGNMHPKDAFLDAKPIPNSDKIVMVRSYGHGANEHIGCIDIVSIKKGPNNLSSAKHITSVLGYHDPYPLSEKCFIVAKDKKILLMNEIGKIVELYSIPKNIDKSVWMHEPRPIITRKREIAIVSRYNPKSPDGQLILQNVYIGRNKSKVKQGIIKKLLIVEPLPHPVSFSGTMEPITWNGSFMIERIIGTVPVESDGSANFKLPANRPFLFVALDENDNAVKRMNSFTTVMPGEVTSCIGCHENRTEAPPNMKKSILKALERPASLPKPLDGIPSLIDYTRDVQPILDKYCLKCHDNLNPNGGVVLNGNRGLTYSLSYFNLTAERQFTDGRNRERGNYSPYEIGSGNSELITKVTGIHHNVMANKRDLRLLKAWIDTAAVYAGTYTALGTGAFGFSPREHQKTIVKDKHWKKITNSAKNAFTKRCFSCHSKSPKKLPIVSIAKGCEWRTDYPRKDLRWKFFPDRLYNLSEPSASRILLAPLSNKSGGLAGSKYIKHKIIFDSTDDLDYQAILAMIMYSKKGLDKIKRFDMPDFKPNERYITYMKKYGVLPENFDITKDKINVYETDKKYFDLFKYKPITKEVKND